MIEQRIALRIVQTELPQGIHGMSAKDGETFIVVINENDTQDKQEETFIHEMLHIWNGDHDHSAESLKGVEAQRHKTAERLKSQK